MVTEERLHKEEVAAPRNQVEEMMAAAQDAESEATTVCDLLEEHRAAAALEERARVTKEKLTPPKFVPKPAPHVEVLNPRAKHEQQENDFTGYKVAILANLHA